MAAHWGRGGGGGVVGVSVGGRSCELVFVYPLTEMQKDEDKE